MSRSFVCIPGRWASIASLCCVLVCAAAMSGCHQPEPRTIIESKLEGTWEEVNPPPGGPSPSPSLSIHADGTFDLKSTMLAMCGDVDRLRYAGQSLTTRDFGGGRIEVLRGEYSPTHSLLVLKLSGHDERGRPYELISARVADLNEDGTMTYREGKLASPSTPFDTIPTWVCRRIGPFPDRAAQEAAAAAEWAFLSKAETKLARTDRGDRYCLALPKEGPAPRRMVVDLAEFSDADAEPCRKAHNWFRDVVRDHVVVLVPGVDILRYRPESELERNKPLLSADAPRVLAMVEKARADLGIEEVYLLAEGMAGYPGRYIWVTDNRPFSGFLTLDTDACEGYPAPTEHVNRATPIHIWSCGFGGAKPSGVESWYTREGFTSLDVRQLPLEVANNSRRRSQACLQALFGEEEQPPVAPPRDPSTRPAGAPPAAGMEEGVDQGGHKAGS